MRYRVLSSTPRGVFFYCRMPRVNQHDQPPWFPDPFASAWRLERGKRWGGPLLRYRVIRNIRRIQCGMPFAQASVRLWGQRTVLFLVIIFLLIPRFVTAAPGIPKIITHQGRLFDADGALLGGNGTEFCFRFSLYDDNTVGAPDIKLWPSGNPSPMTLVVKSGIFSAPIGDTSAGGDVLDFSFQETDTVYLNVEVAAKVGATCASGDGAEVFEALSPRQRLTASPYAITAARVAGAGSSAVGTTTPLAGAALTVVASSSNAVPLILRGAENQSVDLFRIQNAAGTGLLFVGSNGNIFASSTLQVTGLSTFYSGFIANASSSVGGRLTASAVVAEASVSIGTSTPQANFHLRGNGGLAVFEGADHAYLQFYPAGFDAGRRAYMGFASAGNQNFTIANESSGAHILLNPTNGNVGIGTGAPSSKLEIVGGYATSGLAVGGFGLHLGSGGGGGDHSQIWWGDNTGWKLHFGTKDAGNAFQPRLTMVDTGEVGIGTTTPAEKLHLANGILLQDTPTNPRVVGGAFLSLPGGGAMAAAVAGRYAYLVFNNASGTDILRIIDATEPSNPTVVGGSMLVLPGTPRSIAVAGRYAAIVFDNTTSTDALRIVDISSPASSTVVGGASLALPQNGQHVAVSGRYAYMTFDNSAGTSTFRVIDVGNPTNPRVIGGTSLTLPAAPRQVVVAGRYAYVAFYSTVATDAFRIIDISDPANPIIAGGSSLILGFSAWSIAVAGRYAYVGFDNAAGTSNLRIVDISNPASPTIIGGSSLGLPGFAKSVAVAGRYAFAAFDNAADSNGFRIIDVGTPANPRVVGGASLSLPGFPKAVAVNGRYAYLAFFQGAGADIFRVVDLTGLEAVSGLLHLVETGALQVSGNTTIGNLLTVGGGVMIDGGGLFSSGGLSVVGDSLFAARQNATSTFAIQRADGAETLFSADTLNNRVKIGDDDSAGNPTTLLTVDTKADAGDPSGVNGSIYYNANNNQFRCFENGSWKDCDTTGGPGGSRRPTTTISFLAGEDGSGFLCTNCPSGGTETGPYRTVNLGGANFLQLHASCDVACNASTVVELLNSANTVLASVSGPNSADATASGTVFAESQDGFHTLNVRVKGSGAAADDYRITGVWLDIWQ